MFCNNFDQIQRYVISLKLNYFINCLAVMLLSLEKDFNFYVTITFFLKIMVTLFYLKIIIIKLFTYVKK